MNFLCCAKRGNILILQMIFYFPFTNSSSIVSGTCTAITSPRTVMNPLETSIL